MQAAVLIDWDNFVGALHETRHLCDRPGNRIGDVLRRLLAEADARAEGAVLSHRTVFLPIGTADQEAQRAFVENKVDVKYTITDKPNAADVDLAWSAARLLSRDVRVCFIVAGDIDYVQPAEQFNEESGKCFLWAVRTRRLSSAVRNYKFTQYVDEILKLKPCPPPTGRSEDLFILCCQRLVDEGFHLQGYNKSIDRLTRQGALGSTFDVQSAWTDAGNKGRLVSAPPPERRIRYEDPDVSRLLASVDIALVEIARRGSRGQPCGRGEAASCIQARASGATRANQVIDLMLRSGYLTELPSGDVTLGFGDAKWGTVRALYRIALIVWGKSVYTGKDVLSYGGIHRRWVDHCFRSRGRKFDDLGPAQQRSIREEAQSLIKRGVAARLLADERGQVRLLEKHPVAVQARRAASQVVKLIASLASPFEWVDEDDLISAMRQSSGTSVGPPYGEVESEFYFWIASLAAEWHIDRSDRRIRLRKSSKLVEAVL